MIGYLILAALLLSAQNPGQEKDIAARPADYLNDVRALLKQEWPANRTVNLVFHGHSVPAGYFKTPEVRTLESYPFMILRGLKALYPNAVINIITTAVGGENSAGGAKRFETDVLSHKPDVLFIDYGLNDRSIGLEAARIAWESMIKLALAKNIKVILLTPSPDLEVDILDPGTDLAKHAAQIRALAEQYDVGLVDSYALFRQIAAAGRRLDSYMSQSNHPNAQGHELIADAILSYFRANLPAP
jgi:acyl-CoA thioesterase-1